MSTKFHPVFFLRHKKGHRFCIPPLRATAPRFPVAASVSEWKRIHSLTLAATTPPSRSELRPAPSPRFRCCRVEATFFFINLYTALFQYFWNGLHKAIFFAILAASFWLLGRKAESLWKMKSFRKQAEVDQ